ncbi:MAG: iron-containing redox enzyme family protein [Cyanobacteria bacterium]|nr:iron-containing redox enzyme family protein [Cyanobacteriota bacterium]
MSSLSTVTISAEASSIASSGLADRVSTRNTSHALNLIDSRIALYCDQISNHPVAPLLARGQVSIATLYDCAVTQFKSSILWVPLLSLLKDRAKNQRLKQALLANLLCESGARGLSHVQLCSRFVESVRAHYRKVTGNADISLPLDTNLSEVLFVAELAEPVLTGWLLAAEALTPATDKILLDGFRHVPGIDEAFLLEHIAVDSEEHAIWMREAAGELLTESNCLTELLAGVDLGGRAEIKLLDSVYSRSIV